MTNQPNWLELAKGFEKISPSSEVLRAEWFAFDGREAYGIWLVRPGGPATEEMRASLSLLAARAIARLGIAPIPTPQPEQHFPDWSRWVSDRQSKVTRGGKIIDLSDAVPYGLGRVDQDAVDPCTRSWLEWLRGNSPAFRSAEEDESVGDQLYRSHSGSIEDVCLASAVACKRLAREEMADHLQRRLRRAEPNSVARQGTEERGKRRSAVVFPILKQKHWTRGRLVTESGVGKATVYGYLDGTRVSINEDNRRAIAEVLGLQPDQLPL